MSHHHSFFSPSTSSSSSLTSFCGVHLLRKLSSPHQRSALVFSFLDLNGAEILIATAMPIFVPFYFDLFVLHFWNDLRNGSKKF